MLIDLHMHTNCSDGELTPEQLVTLIRERQVTHFAIADHDTIKAYEQLANTEITHSTLITALEFNTDGPNGELHILGYGLNLQNEQLIQYCEMRREERIHWSKKIVVKLQELGYPIDYEKVQQRAEGGIIVRTHIADELVSLGYFENAQTAYEKLLTKGSPAFEVRKGATSAEAIQMIHHAGGLAVLAHPGIYKFEYSIEKVLAEGIDGIEVFYPLHSEDQVIHFKQIADKYNLYKTVGSDFHGVNSRSPYLPGSVVYEEADVVPFLEALSKKSGVNV